MVAWLGEHVGNITRSNTKLSHGSPTLSLRRQQGIIFMATGVLVSSPSAAKEVLAPADV